MWYQGIPGTDILVLIFSPASSLTEERWQRVRRQSRHLKRLHITENHRGLVLYHFTVITCNQIARKHLFMKPFRDAYSMLNNTTKPSRMLLKSTEGRSILTENADPFAIRDTGIQ